MRVMGLEKGMAMDRETWRRRIYGFSLAGKNGGEKNLVCLCDDDYEAHSSSETLMNFFKPFHLALEHL